MKFRIYKGYRVRDRAEVQVTGMLPETPEDEAILDRLDELGMLGRGDSFPEQEEHARLLEERRRAGIIPTPTAEDLEMIRRLEEQKPLASQQLHGAAEQPARERAAQSTHEPAAS
jgi:hypothetical protein